MTWILNTIGRAILGLFRLADRAGLPKRPRQRKPGTITITLDASHVRRAQTAMDTALSEFERDSRIAQYAAAGRSMIGLSRHIQPLGYPCDYLIDQGHVTVTRGAVRYQDRDYTEGESFDL